jgi:hypothetical protein
LRPGQLICRSLLPRCHRTEKARARARRLRLLHLQGRGSRGDQEARRGRGSESCGHGRGTPPIQWRGTDSRAMLFESTSNGHYWPSYGMLSFNASSRDSLQVRLHRSYARPQIYVLHPANERSETLLGPGAPRPMVYGKWLDFRHARGVAEPRERRASDLVPPARRAVHQALLKRPRRRGPDQVPPHPTLLYNTVDGAPGDGGKPILELGGGFTAVTAAGRTSIPGTGCVGAGAKRRSSKDSRTEARPRIVGPSAGSSPEGANESQQAFRTTVAE